MTKRKPKHEHQKRGPKPKPKADLGRRTRAKSPFLLDADVIAAHPRGQFLLEALGELPQPTDEISTALVTTKDLPVLVPGVRTELTTEQIETALTLMAKLEEREVSAYADNSQRGMRSDWRHWIAFCSLNDRVAMPIRHDDLADFIQALIDAGYARASLEHLLFTLKAAAEIWGCPSPTGTLLWRSFWRDRCRKQLSKMQHQAPALNFEDLDEIVESSQPDDPRAIRDMAFASVAYDLMARASEVVAMRWSDIDFQSDRDGGANYLMLRSKTDQEGKGKLTYLTPPTVQLLKMWEEHRFAENPFVFHALPRYEGQELDRTRPLNVREAARIFERVSRRAGLTKALSGHSARVGGAQDFTRAGGTLPEVMQAGRWSSPNMPARYAAKEIASRHGKSRARAIQKLRERSE